MDENFQSANLPLWRNMFDCKSNATTSARLQIEQNLRSHIERNGLLSILHPKDDELKLIITDLSGRVLFEKKCTEEIRDDLDISAFSSGAYICEVSRAGNKLFTEKIILVK